MTDLASVSWLNPERAPEPRDARVVAGRQGNLRAKWGETTAVARGIELALRYLDGERPKWQKLVRDYGVTEEIARRDLRSVQEAFRERRKTRVATRRAQGFQPRRAEGSTPSAASKDAAMT